MVDAEISSSESNDNHRRTLPPYTDFPSITKFKDDNIEAYINALNSRFKAEKQINAIVKEKETQIASFSTVQFGKDFPEELKPAMLADLLKHNTTAFDIKLKKAQDLRDSFDSVLKNPELPFLKILRSSLKDNATLRATYTMIDTLQLLLDYRAHILKAFDIHKTNLITKLKKQEEEKVKKNTNEQEKNSLLKKLHDDPAFAEKTLTEMFDERLEKKVNIVVKAALKNEKAPQPEKKGGKTSTSKPKSNTPKAKATPTPKATPKPKGKEKEKEKEAPGKGKKPQERRESSPSPTPQRGKKSTRGRRGRGRGNH